MVALHLHARISGLGEYGPDAADGDCIDAVVTAPQGNQSRVDVRVNQERPNVV
jgi:hypothetical protein